MQNVVVHHRIQPAASGEHDEQLEIGLAVLDDVLPDGSRLRRVDGQAEVAGEVVRDLLDRRLHERPRTLPLP